MEIEDEADLPSIDLFEHQDDELFDEAHRQIWHIGGPGSGKSRVNGLHFLLRSGVCTDGLYGIFANSYDQLQNAFIPEIKDMLESAGIESVYEKPPPKRWVKRWKRLGIRVPKVRNRYHKLWIWENGVFLYTGTLANNAWRRIKSFEFLFVIVEEVTEGAPLNAITYIWTRLRCGMGKKDEGGISECMRRGHNHQMIVKGNVPLNDPSHWIYKHVEDMKAKEIERLREGKAPFFRLITSATKDNSHLPAEYLDNMAAALDPETYEQQTSGKLDRNAAVTSYHQFTEANILSTLTYGPDRPLHLWFDFNVEPSVAGWGHDLRYDEVPTEYVQSRFSYFGIVGEWFSEAAMTTEQLAHALCEDPTTDQRCKDCQHYLGDHVETGDGQLCRLCAQFCHGDAMRYEWSRKPLHAPQNWRGLLKHRNKIFVYADASGGARHADGATLAGSIGVLRDVLMGNLGSRVSFLIKRSNPSISLRVLAVNRMLRAQNGVRSLFSAPWCTAHNDDFREIVPDPKTGHPKKVQASQDAKRKGDYWKRTHCTDGLGYMVDYRFPAIVPRFNTGATVGTPDGPTSMDRGERDEEDDWNAPR